jgi:hypothetical protein
MALSMVNSAVAFSAPMRVAPRASAIKMNYENELGVIAPTGFFDPLNLSADLDEDKFAQYRTAELKHGRVAQARSPTASPPSLRRRTAPTPLTPILVLNKPLPPRSCA